MVGFASLNPPYEGTTTDRPSTACPLPRLRGKESARRGSRAIYQRGQSASKRTSWQFVNDPAQGATKMRTRISIFTAAVAAFCFATHAVNAQTPAALSGQVSSAKEGAMEGVVVSAKKAGSTITVSVVTDEKNR